jgi:hypothetical protein
MPGKRGRNAVEGPDPVTTIEEFAHKVGADEAGASGDENFSQFSGQRWVTKAASINETCFSFEASN